MQVFVTVGTTSFDNLIEKVLCHDTLKVLRRLGYRKLLLQIGRSCHSPESINGTEDGDLIIESYRYKDSLQEDIEKADLVISHAGAGTCLEVLGAGKTLLVVINEELMNNHQTELAEKLAQEGHSVYCTCSTLVETLRTINEQDLKPFAAGNPKKFASFVDKVMGVS